MMGGLAYMTGPPGRPLRAGTSVIDVTGGMFGVIGILAALEERHRTGRGQKVASSLFETTVYLVGQHMAQKAVTGQAARPMPVRISAWAIYDVFETSDGEQVFVGVVSDSLWEKFCAAFELRELGADPGYRTNAQRVLARETAAAAGARPLQALRQGRPRREARTHRTAVRADRQARGTVRRPAPARERRARRGHAHGRPADATAAAAGRTRRPAPDPGRRAAAAGEHTREVLAGLGIGAAEIESLAAAGAIQ